MRKRLLATSAGIAAALIVASAAPASAFECFNANRSAQGNASAAGSNGLASIATILADPNIVGLCPDGVAFVIAGLEEAGFRTDILINVHTIMASGLEKTGKEDKLADGQGIDHLSEEFFATADGLIGEAFGFCAG